MDVGAQATRRYERYVAIGDSSTEGLDDPDGRGGYRGWANRLAERLAAAQGSLLYANLAVRGRRTREVREQQLAHAVAMRPDLVTVFTGTNDVVTRHFDPDAVAHDMEAIQRTLIEQGAAVLTFTLPDLTPVMPFARLIARRIAALNQAHRAVTARTGAILVDFAAFPVASDRRLWADDRLHANALGHTLIAAALASALQLPGSDHSWQLPLPEPPPRSLGETLAAEAAWARGHLVPWLWRHLQGRSSGDGRQAKRPALLPLSPCG